MRLILLVNPDAGRGKGRRRLVQALDVFRRAGVELQVRESRNAEHLVELARQSASERPDAVVSAGGDGTHHYVMNGVWGTDVPLGILSIGSGNDFAAAMGLPVNPAAAGHVILQGVPKAIDLGRVGDKVYGCIAGVGFDSIVTRYANESVRWVGGAPRYAWAILRCIPCFQPYQVEIQTDTRNFSGEIIFATFGNNISYGGGVRMAPRARVDDGLLDVCIVTRMSALELLRTVPAAYRGDHIRHPLIDYFQARRITLRSTSRLELFADGEFLQELPASIEAVPQALRVILPRDTRLISGGAS